MLGLIADDKSNILELLMFNMVKGRLPGSPFNQYTHAISSLEKDKL